MNRLYYGDNLDVLRRHVGDESVDLVYLDPPFNSNASYNVLFAEQDGTKAASQIKAFEDTWEWNEDAARTFESVIEDGGDTAQAMLAFRALVGESDMLAYLAMMSPRLLELRRVLRKTGSIYLHCDSTASHYLKLLMDATFGPQNFRNELIWKRKAGRGETNNAAIRFGVSTDSLLFYARSDATRLVRQHRPNSEKYLTEKFNQIDADGRRYHLDNISSPSYRKNLVYEYKGYLPPPKGWAVSRERMEEMDAAGRLYFPLDKSHRIRRKRYLDELQGETVDTLWDDIPPINSQAQERLGYPTQKPEALLERIINASCPTDGVVLDPFCGCGTTIAAAQKLNRHWIGIDITHLAITLIRSRLADTFAGKVEYEVVGEPVSMPDATALAASDPYQFQWWALGLVGARPVEQKKGADKGIDGRIYFHVGDAKSHQIILSVKAGHVNVSHVRDLRGVLDREKAEIGVLISLEEPTGPMRKEAASAGFYTSPWGKHASIQLLTVEDLMTGKGIDRPPAQTSTTFKRAPKAAPKGAQKQALDFTAAEDTDEPF